MNQHLIDIAVRRLKEFARPAIGIRAALYNVEDAESLRAAFSAQAGKEIPIVILAEGIPGGLLAIYDLGGENTRKVIKQNGLDPDLMTRPIIYIGRGVRPQRKEPNAEASIE